MVRVLHLISGLNRGGGETDLCKLVSRATQSEYNHQVVSMKDKGPLGQYMTNLGVPVHALHMPQGIPDPRGILKFNNIFYRFQPDILHCWMYHANLMGIFFVRKCRCVWSILCSYIDAKAYGMLYGLTVRLGAMASSLPEVVVTNSHSGKRYHQNVGYHPKRWEVIPNGFDLSQYKPDPSAKWKMRLELDIPSDAIVIGMVARFDPMKDHETFFRAAATLLKRYPNVHFVLAGNGVVDSDERLRGMVAGMTDTGRIHLLGERDDIPALMAGMDIAALSSIGEGFPNAVGEAMATGLPCVVTDVGDLKRIVGDTGIVIRPMDSAALAKALSTLVERSPDILRDMGKRARQRIFSHYTIESNVNRYEQLYRNLLP